MSVSSIVQGLSRQRSGGIAMVTALTFPIFTGMVGLATDTVQWAWIKRTTQRQADSGALAGAFALSQARDVVTTVKADLARNANYPLTETPLIENAPVAGPLAGNDRAVRVVLATDVSLPFSRLFRTGPLRITSEAVAQVVGLGEYCAISLEPTAVAGIEMTGSATVDLNCGMITNSPAAIAVSAGGSSEITASPVAAVGGVPASNNYSDGTKLFPYSVPQADPYADLTDPTIFSSTNTGNVNSNQTRTLSPGNYRGMDLKGNVTLSSGTYYVDGGSFSVGAGANVTGSGVTIVLTSRTPGNANSIATVNMNGGARVNLAAPTSGAFSGVLFYQDRRAPLVNQANKINGNSSSRLQGAIYFPSQEVEFTGNAGMDIRCIQLVARRLKFSGSSTITNQCANSGVEPILGTRVKLVG